MFRWMMVNAILLIKQLAFFKKLPHCDSRTSTQGSTPPPSLWHLYLNLRLRALKTWQEFQVKAAQYNPIMYIIYPLSSIYLSICLSVCLYVHIRTYTRMYIHILIRSYTYIYHGFVPANRLAFALWPNGNSRLLRVAPFAWAAVGLVARPKLAKSTSA